MTPLRDLRKRIAEDYTYKPKAKAKRGRLPAKGVVEGETVKHKGDIVLTGNGRIVV